MISNLTDIDRTRPRNHNNNDRSAFDIEDGQGQDKDATQDKQLLKESQISQFTNLPKAQ